MVYQLLSDKGHVDQISSIPMPHFTFLLQNILHRDYFVKRNSYNVSDRFLDFCEIVGSAVDGSIAPLENFSSSSEITDFQKSLYKTPCVVSLAQHNVRFTSSNTIGRRDVCVITENVHPGYCRLKPADSENECWQGTLFEAADGKKYIKYEQKLSLRITYQSLEMIKQFATHRIGFACNEWPDIAKEWVTRNRPCAWPDGDSVNHITGSGCTLIKRPCSGGEEADLEWMFVFSKAEKYLFQNSVSEEQRHGYNILKSLVDYQLRLVAHKLKVVHLRSIFFYACEVIPEVMWKESLGSCVIYMASQLLSELKSRNIPNYFIKENNMIDQYVESAVDAIVEQIEPIRFFPIETMIFMAERYGISLIDIKTKVVKDIDLYVEDVDLEGSIQRNFIPVQLGIVHRHISALQFSQAHVLLCKTYDMHRTRPAMKDGSPSPVQDRIPFFESFLRTITTEAAKELFAFYLEQQENMEYLRGNSSFDTKLVKEIVGGEDLGGMETRPVPEFYANNLSREADFLGELAVLFFRQQRCRESGICLKWAIKHVQTAMKVEYIQVDEITDSELKTTIGRQNMTNLNRWNNQLFKFYRRLQCLFTYLDKIELIREYMDDVEELHDRAPNTTSFVVDLWESLGEPERAKKIQEKGAKLGIDTDIDFVDFDDVD